MRRQSIVAKVETELKFKLPDHQAFLRVLECAGRMKAIYRHLNLYLDTTDLKLKQVGWMARLRITESGCILTFKSTAEGPICEGGLFKAYELEVPVSRKKALSCLARGFVPEGLFKLRDEAFREVGRVLEGRLEVVCWACTTRRIFAEEAEPDLVVDETQFCDGHVDYEIEVECEDVEKARNKILRLAAIAGVEISPQTQTKYERALVHRFKVGTKRAET